MKPKLSELQWQNMFADNQAGIYLVDKTKGDNSFHAVSVLRKILDLKKVGFAGTLDPLASGLLILATGKATRMLDWFHILPKTYLAEIKFGQTSDTYDLEGEIKINKDAKEFSVQELENKLTTFLGAQEQVVPIYSAKKVAGKKLYESARQGKKINLPKSRIVIHELKILDFTYPDLKLEVKVSSGTYIRSLAFDLGEALGIGALLSGLRRTAIGDFKVDQAINLDSLDLAKLAANKITPKEAKKYLDQCPV
ncbi:tRNA pseudouridine(55) synthase TruB [bacterium]|jgi:tRNA pseudouridine55 synthase|nr:tRNA pseudouridine(55) synthase TruB [bacterium]